MEEKKKEEELYRCYCGMKYETSELARLCHAFHQM
jgi:hypothetical protein